MAKARRSRNPAQRIRARTATAILAALLCASCTVRNSNVQRAQTPVADTSNSPLEQDKRAISGLTGVRVVLHADNFFSLPSPRPDTGCAGDAKAFHHPYSHAGTAPSPLPASAMDPQMSVLPAFLKNVSVDLTHANTPDSAGFPNQAYACSFGSGASAPPPTDCATFDTSAGYQTGYYTLYDQVCDGSGPIASADPALSKLLAGGIYFDLDRTALGEQENLLLHLTYFPLGTNNVVPGGSRAVTETESARFKVHLIRTGLTAYDLRAAFQPRHFTYADTDRFPQVVQTLAVLAPPTGQLRQDQILIPLAQDPAIDRIRVERYSGSGLLVEAVLHKAGTK
ncbi:MAG: hypothetical protein NDJ89_14220 [Oligoflexia bacterium]|nr:hypothetical protein [Oligoflexia bacterium]